MPGKNKATTETLKYARLKYKEMRAFLCSTHQSLVQFIPKQYNVGCVRGSTGINNTEKHVGKDSTLEVCKKQDLTEQSQACLHRDKNKYLDDGTAALVLLNISTI